jgi:hypothetical protein
MGRDSQSAESRFGRLAIEIDLLQRTNSMARRQDGALTFLSYHSSASSTKTFAFGRKQPWLAHGIDFWQNSSFSNYSCSSRQDFGKNSCLQWSLPGFHQNLAPAGSRSIHARDGDNQGFSSHAKILSIFPPCKDLKIVQRWYSYLQAALLLDLVLSLLVKSLAQ